jgi:hypothetical protein
MSALDDPDYIFAVNRETNSHWILRHRIVSDLSYWVARHLNPETVMWEGSISHVKKSTPEGRLVKAHQYVYEHLAVGKMKYPNERVDPLFTASSYNDHSMISQLIPGSYPCFQRNVKTALTYLHKHLHECCPNDPENSWEHVKSTMSPENLKIMDQLRVDLCRHTNNSVSRPRKRIAATDDWVDQQMVGLVLRYKCMGAFSDNLHGSVPACWLKELGPEYVECFASPFNHKFDRYYSIYQQDTVFGSLGNFFSMISQNDGKLPDFGKYEINPPWNNQMYQQVQKILKRTLLQRDVNIEVIIVGPNWSDTKWIPGITELLDLNPSYKHGSFGNDGRMQYINDMKAKNFHQKSVYWVFSRRGIPDHVLDILHLNRPL